MLDNTDLPAPTSASAKGNIVLSTITLHEDKCRAVVIELLRLHVVFMHLAFEYGLDNKKW